MNKLCTGFPGIVISYPPSLNFKAWQLHEFNADRNACQIDEQDNLALPNTEWHFYTQSQSGIRGESIHEPCIFE